MKSFKTIFVIIFIVTVILCSLLFTGCSNSSSTEDELKSFFRVDSEKDLKLQNKTITIDYNGETKILPDTGYDGLGAVNIVTERSSVDPEDGRTCTLYLHSQKAVVTDHGKNWHPGLPNVVYGEAIVYYITASGGYAKATIEKGLTTTLQVLDGSPLWVYSPSYFRHKNVSADCTISGLDCMLDIDGVQGVQVNIFGDAWLTITPSFEGLAIAKENCTFKSESNGLIVHSDCYELKDPSGDFMPYDQ